MATLTPGAGAGKPVNAAASDDPFDFAGVDVKNDHDDNTDPANVSGEQFGYWIQNTLLKILALMLKGGNAATVRNQTGATLTKGTLLRVSSYSAANAALLVAKADADDPTQAAVLVLDADLANNTNGRAYPFALVTGLDTSAASAVGAAVYLSGTAGEFTFTAPTGADQIKQRVGVVTVKDAATGAIHFFPALHLVEALGTSALQPMAVSTEKIAADSVTTPKLATGVLQAGKNLLHNSRFNVAQRGDGPFTSASAPANNDAQILLDRWRIISNGNDIADVSKSTVTLASGQTKSCILLDIETANKQVGIFQMLESKDVQNLLSSEDEKASLSFKIQASNTRIGTLRAAIVSLAGVAADTYSHPVSAWNAGANFTPAANWTIEGSAQFTVVDTNELICKLENVALDNNDAVNIGVAIWIDDETNNVGDALRIYDVQLERGEKATEFETRPFAEELALCQRFLNAAASPGAEPFHIGGLAAKYGTKRIQIPFIQPIPLRAAPSLIYTVTAWNSGVPSGTQIAFFNYVAAAYATITGALTVQIGAGSHPKLAAVLLSAETSFSGTDGDLGVCFIGPDAAILFSAEL